MSPQETSSDKDNKKDTNTKKTKDIGVDKSTNAEETRQLKELEKEYEKLGQLQARADKVTGSHQKAELQAQITAQEENIRVKQHGLKIDQALYDTKRLEAYNAELKKIKLTTAKQKDKEDMADQKA